MLLQQLSDKGSVNDDVLSVVALRVGCFGDGGVGVHAGRGEVERAGEELGRGTLGREGSGRRSERRDDASVDRKGEREKERRDVGTSTHVSFQTA